MSNQLTNKELTDYLKIQNERILELENEKKQLETAVSKYQTINHTNGNFKVYLGITRDFKLGFFERRRFVRLLKSDKDVADPKVVFKLGTPSSRFFLELTFPQLTSLIKLLSMTIVGLWVLFTTGSTLFFRVQDWLPI